MSTYSPIPTTDTPLLNQEASDIVACVVDCKGRPASRSNSGGWRSASILIGMQLGERLAFAALYVNLITFLTGPLGLSLAVAAENVNFWSAICFILPLLGGFLADVYLGRYLTIFIFTLVYIVGLGMLTLSAATMPFNLEADSRSGDLHVIFFFIALYLLGIGQSAITPCMQAFGADQLDSDESRASSSFFNWYYFGTCVGGIFSISTLPYVQESIGWGPGYSVSFAIMIADFLLFLAGTTTYRYKPLEGKSSFARIIKQLLCKTFINKSNQPSEFNKEEEGKYSSIARLIPVWATSLIVGVAHAQCLTFFTLQGKAMNRTIFPHFQLSPANFLIILFLTNIIFLPLYDIIFVPTARYFTNIPTGITILQRMGVGIASTILSMLAAAAVESQRRLLGEAMSVWWLVPQFMLMGVSQGLFLVGLSELLTEEVPEEVRSFGAALSLSVSGIGNLLSGVLISLIVHISGGESWFSTDVNNGHLDYFYFLLAGLCMLALPLHLHLSKSYQYRMKRPSLSSPSNFL